ncbi:MAG: LL-diaminopimelate aminotransferase [Candidatus Lokiarchaeota archaeon]|nr:LL-diaminopimelate aminotransferase [Candidatus Lokiarchaeota archaeon]
MVHINENFLKLKSRYLFSRIGEKTSEYQNTHPDKKVIRFGIGDTTQPLPSTILHAFHRGVDEMGDAATYRGYGPEQGYLFLRELIAKFDFQERGADIKPDEIFISDGSKCDTGNILDIFGENIVGITDPAYPVYVDTNIMAGNSGPIQSNGQYEGLVYLSANEANKFCPEPPNHQVDIIYLCSPNNPTGVAMNRQQLTQWVNYALDHHSVILFDAAYEKYIRDDNFPHSIFEIPHAKKVAIEFRSFSKTAGFTGARCAFTVVPKDLMGEDSVGTSVSLHDLWNRRHSTKFNGVSYPVQCAAAAAYTEQGNKEITELLNYYRYNAELIKKTLQKIGFHYWGGENSPYIWVKTPQNLSSWEFFDFMLNNLQIVITPGSGFGIAGEEYFRITCFGNHEDTQIATERMLRWDWNELIP